VPARTLRGPGLLVSVTSREADYGTLLVFFPDATVDALVRLAPNSGQTDADEAGPTETTRRLCAQTAAALDRRAPQCDLIVSNIATAEEPPEGTSLEIVLNGYEQPLQVVLGGTLEFRKHPTAAAWRAAGPSTSSWTSTCRWSSGSDAPSSRCGR
jgi:hypothetical protein